MAESSCRVCGSPVDPSAERCANCGTSYQKPTHDATGGAKRPSAAIFVAVSAVVAAVGFLVVSLTKVDAPETGAELQVAAQPVPSMEAPEPSMELPVPEAPSPTEVTPPDDLLEVMRQKMEGKGEASTEAEGSSEAATLRFGARVVSAKGKKVGGKCGVNVHVTGPNITDLDVACGDVTLYDSRTPLNGMSSSGRNLFERKQGKGWVYRVVYADVGMRSSRSQLRLNSTNKEAKVWSDGSDAFEVALKLDEFSASREGAALMDTPVDVAKLSVALKPTIESGTVPKLGTPCKLGTEYVETSSEGPRCKSELRCGGKVLYGKGLSGFGPCELAEGAIFAFTDGEETHEDGDPSLLVDVAGRTASLADSPGQVDFGVTFEFVE